MRTVRYWPQSCSWPARLHWRQLPSCFGASGQAGRQGCRSRTHGRQGRTSSRWLIARNCQVAGPYPDGSVVAAPHSCRLHRHRSATPHGRRRTGCHEAVGSPPTTDRLLSVSSSVAGSVQLLDASAPIQVVTHAYAGARAAPTAQSRPPGGGRLCFSFRQRFPVRARCGKQPPGPATRVTCRQGSGHGTRARPRCRRATGPPGRPRSSTTRTGPRSQSRRTPRG